MSAVRFRCLVTGTDTGVGKSHVVTGLVRALRRYGRRVWLHKPVATGFTDDGEAEDVEILRPLLGDGQPLASLCQHRYAPPASPHVALRAAGATLHLADLLADLNAVDGADHDLVVEGVGGVAVPLTSDDDRVADYARAAGLPVILVTRPDLGTLNHTCLSVDFIRRQGLQLLGLVVNAARPVEPGLATETAADELVRLTGAPLLAMAGYGVSDGEWGDALVASLLAGGAA